MKPVVLVILDGWGEQGEPKGNPLAHANLPTIQKLDQYYPKTLLQASSLSVGLPWGAPGNSEVGHQTIGTGQIIYQYLPLIDTAIQNGSFFENEILLKAFEQAKANNSRVHLLGLTSDGGVHSHIRHLISLLEMAARVKFPEVYLHAVTDGRDTSPKSAEKFLGKVQEQIQRTGVGKIATVTGRYHTMDRNQNYDRVERGYLAMTVGEGIQAEDPLAAIQEQYQKEIFDEFIEPIVVTEEGQPVATIQSGDVVIFFNYREDRARQISQALAMPNFDKFEKAQQVPEVQLFTFTEYESELPATVVFPPQEITVRLGEEVSKAGKKQYRIAETEKYAHVTYFFNGGLEKPLEGEEREIIPSQKVATYDQAPEMSAQEITDKLSAALETQQYDFILVNYANPDMVGHTGDYEAGVKAVEETDRCLGILIKAVLAQEGSLLITADHGNVEEMVNLKTGERDTEHSTNPVPCWLVSPDNHRSEPLEMPMAQIQGMIVDIPPTVLNLMELEQPAGMSGASLLGILV